MILDRLRVLYCQWRGIVE